MKPLPFTVSTLITHHSSLTHSLTHSLYRLYHHYPLPFSPELTTLDSLTHSHTHAFTPVIFDHFLIHSLTHSL